MSTPSEFPRLVDAWSEIDRLRTERSPDDTADADHVLLDHLYSTTDAMVWAQEWCTIAREIEAADDGREVIDAGWMVGWFANAIETAKGFERRRIADELPNAHGQGSGHPDWCEACAVASAIAGADPARRPLNIVCGTCGAPWVDGHECAAYDPTFVPSSKRTYPRCNAIVPATDTRCERIAHDDRLHFAISPGGNAVTWYLDTEMGWASDVDDELRTPL